MADKSKEVCSFCDRERYPIYLYAPTKDMVVLPCRCRDEVHAHCFNDKVTDLKKTKGKQWKNKIQCPKCESIIPLGITLNRNLSTNNDLRKSLLDITFKMAVIIALVAALIASDAWFDATYVQWIGFVTILLLDCWFLKFISIHGYPLSNTKSAFFLLPWYARIICLLVDALFTCMVSLCGFFMFFFFSILLVVATIPNPYETVQYKVLFFELSAAVLLKIFFYGPGIYLVICSMRSAYSCLFRQKILMYCPSWIEIKS